MTDMSFQSLLENIDLVKNLLSVKRMKRIIRLDQKLAHTMLGKIAHDVNSREIMPARIHLHAKRNKQYLV